QQARFALDEQRRQRPELTSERGEVATSLQQVTRQLRRKGLSKNVRDRLGAEQTKLQTMPYDADPRVADNVQSIYDAQQALVQATLDAQQKTIDNITSRYDRLSKGMDRALRVATALGQENIITSVGAQQRDLLQQQANELAAQIAPLRAIGTEEAVKAADDLSDQVDDIRVQIFESLQQS